MGKKIAFIADAMGQAYNCIAIAQETEKLGHDGHGDMGTRTHEHMNTRTHEHTQSGTTITLTLPKEPAPDWFVPKLTLQPNSTLVILDDDISIHNIWDGRLQSMQAKQNGITIQHFSTPEEVSRWTSDEGRETNLSY